MSVLSIHQIHEAGLDDWRMLHHALQARFRTGSFAVGAALVAAIAEVADEMDHHPDLDLRYPHLNVRLFSHDSWGVTGRDVRLARRISALAADAGVEAAPEDLSVIEIALDTPDLAAVRPFWAAVLGMASPVNEDEVRDDSGDLPRIWFQSSGSTEPRQRFHLDVRVPPEQAQARIDAALAAGGTLVTDSRSPAFVVLADADGNKACVCTELGRDG